jgi:hypothetical protein
MSIVLTDFARPRLFPRVPRGNTIQDCTAEQFEAHLNAHAPLKVLDGYAPFCKLFVYENWTSTLPDGAGHRGQPPPAAQRLRSAQPRGTAGTGALVRGVESPRANYLVVILYNAEQLAREGSPIEADWGIVGCIYTAEPEEVPMAPITMMRNALGVEEGGSGVPLDRRLPALGGVLGEQRQLAAGVGSPHRGALTRSFDPGRSL